ncbi:energy-coupling factor transporter transmembrane protein EcfT, partial [Gallintestinimicrobium sp.]|uniref:energy-coupling factor transporter transmembrane component T family protein n=1 Tax=Gallintestinimicrobium sp. TaxID=2981655 RepID=UPI00307D5AAC
RDYRCVDWEKRRKQMMQMPMGQYRPGNTFFHRADAKGKLLGLCLVIAAVIVSKGLFGCIAAAAAALTVSYLAGISLREQIKQQKGMCRFLAVIFLMNAFFYSGEHCIWSWWIFRLSREGIRQGAMVVVHLVLILVFCMVLTITTEPMEITHGLEELLSPLSKVGVPTEEIAMILGVAMQFIPVLGEEAETIRMAQTARGARFESKKLTERAASFLPLVIPVFLAAFRRADELACAMEARGYRGPGRRTKTKKSLPNRNGNVAIAASAIFLIMQVFLQK